MVTVIILAHFKEREKNLKRIVDDLMFGTVKPQKIIIFIDNPKIYFKDERVTIIRSNTPFLPNIRFALGSVAETPYCFFLDDDLTVKPKTLENFLKYATDEIILGLEGSILGNTETPYSNDTCITRGNRAVEVDIIIRTYFVPTKCLMAGLLLRATYPDLPKLSLDDVFLCLGNKYINNSVNVVIPVDEESDLVELNEGGVGQSRTGDHYKNRNEVCRFFQKKYE